MKRGGLPVRMSNPGPAAVDELSDVDLVRGYVVERGIAEAIDVSVERLTGGVSSFVYRIRVRDDCFVLKQARRRLDVAREWLADPRRSGIEAAFADLAASLVPGAVPRPRFADDGRHVFAMDCAPDGSTTWKSQLLAGTVDAQIAEQAGQLIGRIHVATSGDPSVAVRFDDLSVFDQLRVDPYFRSLTISDAAAAARVDTLARKLLERGRCLVHGDFSPKNLLVTPDGRLVLVDHEVAHFGDPAFDVAFCLSHLCLKAYHAPRHAWRLLGAARTFVAAYGSATGGLERSLDERVAMFVCALMLARVDGKSRVEYLDDRARHAVRSFAIDQLARGSASVASVLASVQKAAA